MAIQRFEDILAWRKAREVVRQIYLATRHDSFARDFALRDQIRRSGISVMANIAEGFNRNSRKDFARFLNIAIASVSETKSHLYVAKDLCHISDDEFSAMYESLDEGGRLIHGLIEYLRSDQAKKFD